MSLRKPFRRGRVWYCEVDGRRVSLRTDDRDAAQRLFTEIKRQHLAGKLTRLSGECTITLEQYREQYIAWAEHAQEWATFRANRLALDKLMGICGKTILLDRIQRKALDDLVSQSRKARLSTASINNYIRHARSAMNKAVEWGIIQVNPFAGFKELPKERKPPRFLDRADTTKLLARIESLHTRRMVAAYLSTGRRRGELLALEWQDVDLEGSKYLVRRSKTHLSRHYPINDAFRAVLLAIGPQDSGRVFDTWHHPDTISHKIKAELQAQGFGHVRLHDLRHSFAVNFLQAGGSLRALQDLLGHTEYRTTEIYAHMTEDHLQQEANRVRIGPVALT
jgi:integrase